MENSTNNLVLAPDDAIDLQLHTILSDGTWTPDQLIDHLIDAQFSLAAITDHDRVDIIDGLQQLAITKGFPLLAAVEMTTMWNGGLTDILCYGFGPDKSALDALAQDVTHRQQEKTREVYENLCRQGHISPLPPDELTALLEKPGAQQPRALVTLVKKYGVGAAADSPGKILRDAGVSFETNDTAAVVDAAHRSGSVCLIAHPGRSDGFICYDTDLLDRLRLEIPVDGLEVYYPAHSAGQTDLYCDYARQHHWLTSSGSDSHDSARQPVKYRAELSRSLLERTGIQIR